MKVFCFHKGPEENGREAAFAEAAVCRTVYVFMYICLVSGFFFSLSCVECIENYFRLRRKMFVYSSSNSFDGCLVLSTVEILTSSGLLISSSVFQYI